jgi:hypothetical protein
MNKHNFSDEHLTEHFTLREMLHSTVVDETPGMVNYMDQPELIVSNLRQLCQQVLEPLRQAVNQPVVVSSGSRSEYLNFAVGGSKKSQHRLGEAADLLGPTERCARMYYNYIRAHLPYDQLLLEHRKRTGMWWVHVSYTTRRPLRRDAREMAV